MSQDTQYKPVEMVYESKGIIARAVTDECPPGTFLNLMNAYERAENSMSSRYGTQIINRDPVGVGTSNYFFPDPITTLARLTYKTNAYRYAGDSEGNLYRRTGNTQGQYTNIFTGLSGSPFGWLDGSTFESSLPYLFIYDANTSIKDSGTGTPELTGIDSSPYTLNTVPYSPLLTLIDNFAPGNAYTTSGFSGGWAYSAVTKLQASSGQTVTDFTDFFGVQPFGAGTFSIAGGANNASVTAPGSTSNVQIYSGFASAPVTGTETVSLSMFVNVPTGGIPGNSGSRTISLDYSINSGVTWTNFFSQTGSSNQQIGGSPSLNIPGLSNIDTLQIRSTMSVIATAGTVGGTATTFDINAVITAPDVFNQITNGMLSVLNTNTVVQVPISSIVTSGFAFGMYTALLITTQEPHGLTGTTSISIYGSSNDLLDGFYTATVSSATTLTVPYKSGALLSATGGTLNGGAAAPNTCVLTAEYSNPYPPQMSAWGFYQQVPTTETAFQVGSFVGTVAQNTTATVGVTVPINLNINNQATDDDLIVLTLAVGDPAAISNIRIQFDVNGSGYTSAYYYKDISPVFYQAGVQQLQDAYTTTEQQIFADTLGLLTGQVPNSTTAQLQPGNISTGQGSWQTIYLRRGDFTPIGNAGESGSDWTAVTGWQLVITTNTVGSSTVACNGLYFQWGYGPSSFGGTGYDYRATYYDANTGTESNGTPEQEFNTQFGYLASLAAPFFLRQAAQVNGFYSNDPQVTHVRIYRRGGIYPNNWLNIDQIPNVINAVARFNPFSYKDVIPDAALAQAPGLILDNDPPVTSSLEDPIATTLSLPTSSPGSSLYSAFVPQLISVAQASAVFVANQTVVIGNAVNLEEIQVITGGTGSFTGILRLQHNAGEPVYAFSTPRTPCDQCAFAYGQVWLAGDKNNPNFLYYSKPGYPENFGPEDYLEVGSSSDIINAVVNWRGTLYVGTQLSWYVITGGATPGWQPTGSIHGIVANKGWTQAEGGIWYQAADGQRLFRGSEGTYMTLEVEWLYRLPSATQVTPIPLVDTTQLSQVVMAFWNNDVYLSYVSLNNSGQRYRLIYNTSYNRFRDDDIPATAMLWEQDTNLLLTAKQLGTSANYVIVQEGVGDSDDGGWAGTQLTTLPIALDIQTPYRGSSHFPNQFNVLETDASTASQDMATTLLFDTEPPVSLVLDTFNTEGVRQKNQLQINDGDGQQAYSMSIQHTMNVFNAPVLYQENIYVAVLAGYRTSRDTYWIKFGTDASKLVKQGYFDYQSTAPIIYNLYADGSDVPYYTFTLPAAPNRAVVRVRFGQNDGVNSAVILRTFRMIGTSTAPYQDWANPRVEFKAVAEGASYAIGELNP